MLLCTILFGDLLRLRLVPNGVAVQFHALHLRHKWWHIHCVSKKLAPLRQVGINSVIFQIQKKYKMTLTEEDSILIKNVYLLKWYGAKRLIKKHFSPLWIHLRVNLVCIKSFYQQDNEYPHAVHYEAHSAATSPYLLPINDVIVTSS